MYCPTACSSSLQVSTARTDSNPASCTPCARSSPRAPGAGAYLHLGHKVWQRGGQAGKVAEAQALAAPTLLEEAQLQ